MKFFLFLFLLLLNFNGYSQQTFTKSIINDSTERVINIIEDGGAFVVSGVSLNNGMYSGIIIKIDSAGNLINTKYFSDSIYDLSILSSVKLNRTYCFVGSKSKEGVYDSSYLWVLVTDDSLNTIAEHYYYLGQNTNMVTFNTSIIDDDSNIVVSGYYFKNGQYFMKPYLFKINSFGDSLISNINNFPDTNSFFFQVFQLDSNKYGIAASWFMGNGEGQIVEVDDSLNYINHIIVNNDIGLGSYGSVVISDSEYYVFYSSINPITSDHMVKVCKFMNDNIIQDIELGSINSYSGAALRGISKCNDGLLVGFTDNFYPQNGWFGRGQESSFVITKLDFSLNILWQKNYLFQNAYVNMTGVLSTSDNGCIMIGSISDNNSLTQKNDILIIKVDSNGNTTWTQNISQPEVKLIMYPNPVVNQLNLQLKSLNQSITSIQIFNIQGKEVLNKQSNSAEIKLDVSSLSSGVYLVNGRTNDGVSFSRKFVKE